MGRGVGSRVSSGDGNGMPSIAKSKLIVSAKSENPLSRTPVLISAPEEYDMVLGYSPLGSRLIPLFHKSPRFPRLTPDSNS